MFGWEVKHSIGLPEGFKIREDADFVYVYYGDKFVAMFRQCVEAEELLKTCEGYLKKCVSI